MIKLGNTILCDDLQLTGLEETKRVAATTYTSLGGESSTIAVPLSTSGRPLDLISRKSGDRLYGFFTQAQLDSIKAIEETGLPATLIHPRGTFTVLVAGVENPQQVFEVNDPTPDRIYTAIIKLIEV